MMVGVKTIDISSWIAKAFARSAYHFRCRDLLCSAPGGVYINASGAKSGIEFGIGGTAPQIICGNGVFANSPGSVVSNDIALAFSVPRGGWMDGTLYSSSPSGTFAAFSGQGHIGKVVVSIDPRSDAFRSARTKAVPLVAWKGGIDVDHIALVEAPGVRYCWTYGWPSTLPEPENEGDAPTGLSTIIHGHGALLIRVH